MRTGPLLRLISIVALCFLGVPELVNAAPLQPFDDAQFAAAKSSNEVTLVQFYAEWCPICRRQRVMIDQILDHEGFGKIRGFFVDFDSGVSLRKQFSVAHQSTIVLYRNGREVARSVAETDPDRFQSSLQTAMK